MLDALEIRQVMVKVVENWGGDKYRLSQLIKNKPFIKNQLVFLTSFGLVYY